MEYAFDTKTFSPWDYVVFALVLVISVCIGIFYGCTGGKQKTTAEFLMADRQMSVLPVSLSLLASFMSAITLLGTPAEMYIYGTQYWLIWLGYVIMIPLTAHVFIPIFFQLRLTSVFEYLELRFSRGLRIAAAIIFIVQMILYMAIVLYTPSLALNVVTGLNVWISVFSVGVACTFYTTIGGMKAVMWTDVFQIMTMFAGLIAVLVQGSVDQGGFGRIWEINKEGGRLQFFDFNPNPFMRHNFWSVVFGGCFTWLAVYGTNQAQVQRALCLPNLRSAQIAMWINLPGLTALLTVCSLCGLVMYAEYQHCDPLLSKRIKASDQLLPIYVMDRLSQFPGLAGLFTACLFSGALSTISSGLNSLSAVTLQDLVRLSCFPKMSESRATFVSKIIAGSYGALMIALTFVAAQLGGVLQAALGLFGMLGGPLLGLFILGMIFPWANWKGGYAGLFLGLILTLWMGIGAQVYKPYVPKANVSVEGCPVANATWWTTVEPVETSTAIELPPMKPEDKAGYLQFYESSYLWYSCFACTVVCVSGLLVSLATGPNKASDVDPRLICPIFDTFCCCLPQRLRQKLQCDIEHEGKYEEEVDKLEEDKKEPKLENGFTNPTLNASSVSIQYETHL